MADHDWATLVRHCVSLHRHHRAPLRTLDTTLAALGDLPLVKAQHAIVRAMGCAGMPTPRALRALAPGMVLA